MTLQMVIDYIICIHNSCKDTKQFGNKRALSKKFENKQRIIWKISEIPNIYKDNFVDLAKLCDSAKKIIH